MCAYATKLQRQCPASGNLARGPANCGNWENPRSSAVEEGSVGLVGPEVELVFITKKHWRRKRFRDCMRKWLQYRRRRPRVKKRIQDDGARGDVPQTSFTTHRGVVQAAVAPIETSRRRKVDDPDNVPTLVPTLQHAAVK
ncbi:hypothetical protein pipiens_010725 [Culex pipiens pipiens]|uniref:Uncharacterized protein n=1 Tax=Culex pipiens pipiens TaxID=38569 RepID=A0ABD1D9Z0_CULPP